MDVPKIPFRILITIGEDDEYIDTGIGSFTLERDELNLLIRAFYIPTGIFATLSIGSYIINPDIVSNIDFLFKH